MSAITQLHSNPREEIQLELPLFVEPDSPPETAEILPFGHHREWSDDEISWIREWLLNRSLAQLKDHRVADHTKQEMMDWVMSDEIHPFSFVICCREAGYSSERLRDGVIHTLCRINQQEGK